MDLERNRKNKYFLEFNAKNGGIISYKKIVNKDKPFKINNIIHSTQKLSSIYQLKVFLFLI